MRIDYTPSVKMSSRISRIPTSSQKVYRPPRCLDDTLDLFVRPPLTSSVPYIPSVSTRSYDRIGRVHHTSAAFASDTVKIRKKLTNGVFTL